MKGPLVYLDPEAWRDTLGLMVLQDWLGYQDFQERLGDRASVAPWGRRGRQDYLVPEGNLVCLGWSERGGLLERRGRLAWQERGGPQESKAWRAHPETKAG